MIPQTTTYQEGMAVDRGLEDMRAIFAEMKSRQAPPMEGMSAHAEAYVRLRQDRESNGGLLEPSFEEVRAYRATQGMTITDEDYQHELEIYRKETGLDLADAAREERGVEARLKQRRFDSEIALESAEQVRGLTSLTYLDVRGAFYKVQLLDQSGKARGVYAIEEMNHTARDDKQGQLEAPILITGVETTQNDIVSLMSCLNNTKLIYTFGQSFGNVSISGEILLGPLGNMVAGERGGVRRIMDFFWTYRVSVYEKPITVSINGEAFYTYLTGLRLGKVDPELHTMPFLLIGTLLDLSREEVENGVGNVNPSSSVNSDSGLERGLTISDRLRPETSQAGPPASEAAAVVDAHVRSNWDYRENWDQLVTGEPLAGELDGSDGLPLSDAELIRRQEHANNRATLSAMQAADRPVVVVKDDSARKTRMTEVRTAIAEDLKKHNSQLVGAGALAPSPTDQRRAALNRAAYDLSKKEGDAAVGLDTATGETAQDRARAKARVDAAFVLASERHPELFKGADAPVRRDVGLVFLDERPQAALELDQLSSRADVYARQKTENPYGGDVGDGVVVGKADPEVLRTIKHTVYSQPSTQAAVDARFVVLSDKLSRGEYPKEDYNKLAKEFGKAQVP